MALLAALPAWAFAGACDTGALRALPVWADAGEAPGKFALAEAACGPLGRAAVAPDGSSTPTPGPRIAEQLRLYGASQGKAPLVVSIAPLDAGPLPASRVSPAGRPAAVPAASGTVARIVSLVPAVSEVARRFGIDPLLLHAVAHVESRHQPAAQSPAGARGVLQVMPDTARRFGLDDPRRELLEPSLNLQVGAEYLKTLQQRFGNDLTLVLAAYNAGEGAVEKYGRRVPPYPETQAYVRDVLATYAELRRRVGAAAIAGSV